MQEFVLIVVNESPRYHFVQKHQPTVNNLVDYYHNGKAGRFIEGHAAFAFDSCCCRPKGQVVCFPIQ
jgi:hypothetical protein